MRTASRSRIAIAVITATGFAIRLAVWFRPFVVLDRIFVPDDTYYTLNIAHSLARGHGPTVDGSTLTSGFQPLLAFLMVPVFWLTNRPIAAVKADMALLILFDTATIAVLAWVANRLAGRVAAVAAAALWAVSPVALSMALGGLETSLAIFFEVALVAMWIAANDRPSTRRTIAVGVVAALAILARVDAIFLVGALAAVQLWRGPRAALVPRAVACAVTLAPWWGWCLATFGTPIPTSGRAAHSLATWGPLSKQSSSQALAAASGGPFHPDDGTRLWLIRHASNGAIALWLVVGLFVLVGLVWAGLLRRRSRADVEREAPDPLPIAAALPIFAAALLVFYAWFALTYYFTRYLAPVALVVTLVVAVGLGHLAASRARTLRVALVAVVSLLVLGGISAVRLDLSYLSKQHDEAPSFNRARSYDARTGYAEVARQIVQVPPHGSVVGGFQSGALGYFGLGRLTVVNLDGVVNPDAEAASRNGRVAEYVRKRRIGWVADDRLFVLNLIFQLQSEPGLKEHVVKAFPSDGVRPEYWVLRIRYS